MSDIEDDFDDETKSGFWRIAAVVAVFWCLALFGAWKLAHAGGTVTDSKYIWLQRSGVTLTDKTTPKLACTPPKTMLECAACMAEMIDAEVRRRTSGYVTYRCLDAAQSRVVFNKTPVPEPEPPVVTPPSPTAQLLVYTCADDGADGRILESDTVRWPNCKSVSYQPPSKSLVVAVNPGSRPFYWRLASKLTDERIWTQTGTVGAWVRAESISWAPSSAGSVTLSWTPPTKNTDDTPLTNLAGYRIVYGASATALDKTVEVSNPTVTSYIVEGLKPGTYYFGVKSYTTTGAESVPSKIASKAIQ